MENPSWVGCLCDSSLSEVLLSDPAAPSAQPILANTLGLARGDISSEDVAGQSQQQCHGSYTNCLCASVGGPLDQILTQIRRHWLTPKYEAILS